MEYSRDIFGLMYRLRGALARDQYGLLHDGLYSLAKSGTKQLVKQYYQTISSALNFICDHDDDSEIPTDAKLAFFNETRHCYGRTALLLSGGAGLGYYHIGVVKELNERGLLPRIINGASAGSLITAAIGVRTDAELDELDEHTIPRLDHFRFDWSIPGRSYNWKIRQTIKNLLPQSIQWWVDVFFGVVVDGRSMYKLDVNRLIEVTIENCGHLTFQEAFDRTGRIINITVAPVNDFDPPRLLNYLTAPHVCVWSAAVASCAIPGVFEPVPLIVREPDGKYTEEHVWSRHGGEADQKTLGRYSDGSVENDLPMEQLAELFNVNHFIVSQVNPHSPFLSALSTNASVWTPPLYTLLSALINYLTTEMKNYLKNLVSLMSYYSIGPTWGAKRGFIQALTQDYTGRECDITISPWSNALSFPEALYVSLKNPSREDIKRIILESRRSIWPYIPKIEAHCRIEFTLDNCVQKLRRQIAFEDLELMQRDHVQNLSSPTKSHTSGIRPSSSYTSRSIVSLSGLSVSDPLPGSLDNSRARSTSISSLGTYEEDGVNTTTYRYGSHSTQNNESEKSVNPTELGLRLTRMKSRSILDAMNESSDTLSTLNTTNTINTNNISGSSQGSTQSQSQSQSQSSASKPTRKQFNMRRNSISDFYYQNNNNSNE